MIVALTGGIGSGKSYVCKLLADEVSLFTIVMCTQRN